MRLNAAVQLHSQLTLSFRRRMRKRIEERFEEVKDATETYEAPVLPAGVAEGRRHDLLPPPLARVEALDRGKMVSVMG